ncbi:MAG: hypothetical protein GXY05_13865 [Clostridiales bacterium]|nr:hypothetical protein [Clostridiales bacterium]
MKLKTKMMFVIGTIVVSVFCWHRWYWTLVTWVHPDITRRIEEQYKLFSNEQLISVLGERVSPRTDAAGTILETRNTATESYLIQKLYSRKRNIGYLRFLTVDEDKYAWNALIKKVNGSFTEEHVVAYEILAKLGYEEMIAEAGKFVARGQYDEALEALQYFKGNATARKVLEQIAAQNNDPFAADRAKKMLGEK